MGKMTGKIAVITGANSGIGEATALLFAKEGATVVGAARREGKLEEAAEKVRAAGGEFLCVPTDISDPAAVKKLMSAAVEKYGRIDALVNCAGYLEPGLRPIDRVVDEDLDRVLATNTKGTMYCMREGSLIMQKQEGLASIVNVASVAGVTGISCAAYTASKAAIVGITRNAAIRFAGTNIRVNCVCPGGVATPMISDPNYQYDPDMIGAMGKHSDTSLPICMPEDVANLLLFLSCDDSKSITGQAIVCDFGCNL